MRGGEGGTGARGGKGGTGVRGEEGGTGGAGGGWRVELYGEHKMFVCRRTKLTHTHIHTHSTS